jgi:alkanesulfonate monooxygenase SsuD/methylene tetrahydromethanopterin reductase-like flavin-dependent oxidoreductase (luciferase family)
MRERLGRLEEACRILKSLWTKPRTTFEGRYYRLEDAPLMPKPVQRPHPELMVGGGGERVTLGIVARHADHWNCWGGPDTLGRKGKILEEHCAAAGRDPATVHRSANMLLLLTEDRTAVDRLKDEFMRRMGRDETAADDTLLAGSAAAVRDKLGRLRDAGVGTLFLPTFFLPKDPRPQLDRFLAEIAPSFR